MTWSRHGEGETLCAGEVTIVYQKINYPGGVAKPAYVCRTCKIHRNDTFFSTEDQIREHAHDHEKRGHHVPASFWRSFERTGAPPPSANAPPKNARIFGEPPYELIQKALSHMAILYDTEEDERGVFIARETESS